jgi:hypothetical protein
MRGRKFDTDGYRYGFCGHENDNEVKGNGNQLDFGGYGYDTRLGRRLNINPEIATMPSLSSYSTFNNNPIFYIDPNGRKFVNPYEDQKNEAKQEFENAQTVLDDLIANNGSKEEIETQRKLVKDLNSHYENVNAVYNEVNDYLRTLEMTNKKEYDYFETLKDKDGNDMLISIVLIGQNETGTNLGETDGLATNSGEYKVRRLPTQSKDKGGITIFLYASGKNGGEESGRNFWTFANELGDIQYFFKQVVDNRTLLYFENTNSYLNREDYNDPEGAGQKSFEYEEKGVEDVNKYAKENNKSITTKGTIK